MMQRFLLVYTASLFAIAHYAALMLCSHIGMANMFDSNPGPGDGLRMILLLSAIILFFPVGYLSGLGYFSTALLVANSLLWGLGFSWLFLRWLDLRRCAKRRVTVDAEHVDTKSNSPNA